MNVLRVILGAILLLSTLFLCVAADSALAGIERKLQYLESNGALAHPDPTPTILTEQEIKAYLTGGGVSLPDGVRSLHLAGTAGTVMATAQIDFDRIRTGRNSSNPLLSLFSGVHDVEVNARAYGTGGKGFVHVNLVTLDGVEVPRFLLQAFVEKYLQPTHPEIGIDSQFLLPDRIDSANISTHQLTLIQK